MFLCFYALCFIMCSLCLLSWVDSAVYKFMINIDIVFDMDIKQPFSTRENLADRQKQSRL